MPQPKNTAANLRTPNPARFIVCVGWVGGAGVISTIFCQTYTENKKDSWNTTKLGYKRYINVIKWLPELTGPLALTNFNTTQAICISNSNRERADLLRCKTK